ncbi:MAG TPA: protein-L-isoaspartate(D-aspartate) O-methyltransferase [Actinomycetota bacterium]|nr:protein-L-isoaspartate(D-aspartate) O-methyltransferase [Actinomycetota bacterium]
MPRSKEGLARLVDREGVAPRVVRAFREVAREDFVPDAYRSDAYSDRPVPILERQTTSQPSLIARMIDAADVLPGDRLLEIGTGFGFQTALLSRLGGEVVSVERHPSLARAARENLARAGIENVRVVVGDGWMGWPEAAPYDAIIVSAGAPEVPEAFVDQLVDGGRIVIPLKKGAAEEVVLLVKNGDHLVRARVLTPARFVPLVKGAAPDQSNE